MTVWSTYGDVWVVPSSVSRHRPVDRADGKDRMTVKDRPIVCCSAPSASVNVQTRFFGPHGAVSPRVRNEKVLFLAVTSPCRAVIVKSPGYQTHQWRVRLQETAMPVLIGSYTGVTITVKREVWPGIGWPGVASAVPVRGSPCCYVGLAHRRQSPSSCCWYLCATLFTSAAVVLVRVAVGRCTSQQFALTKTDKVYKAGRA